MIIDLAKFKQPQNIAIELLRLKMDEKGSNLF